MEVLNFKALLGFGDFASLDQLQMILVYVQYFLFHQRNQRGSVVIVHILIIIRVWFKLFHIIHGAHCQHQVKLTVLPYQHQHKILAQEHA